MKTVKLSVWNRGFFTVTSLLISTSLAGAPLTGTLTYAPWSATSIPTLSGSMLLLLSLLLLVVTFRIAKNKNTSKLLVIFLGVSAITLGSGGLKIVTDVNAVVTGLSTPEGGTVSIFDLQLNDYQNTSGVRLQITAVDISGISCDRYQGGSIPIECAPGKILINNESCSIDCSPPRGVIQFATATHRVFEADGTVTVELTRTGGSAGTIEVMVSTSDVTATIGEDYSGLASPFSLTWPDGNTTTKALTFPIKSDNANEPDETFTADLTAPAGDSEVLGSVTSTEVTIAEVSTRGVIQFASAAYTVSEADGSITVDLTRTGGSQGVIDVLVTSFDGTAVIGDDYNGILTPLALSWPDGNTVTRTVTFPILPDVVNEPNETFTAVLTLPPGESGVLGSVTSTEITITNDPTGVIQFASSTYTVSEADGSITVDLTRTGGSQGVIDVLITSFDGTAVIGDDYNGIVTPIALSWPDGNTVTRTVTFPILPDLVNETNETFTAVLTLPAGVSGLLGAVTSTEITITDDPRGVIQFASAAYTVSEFDGFITVELTRTGGSHGVIDVLISSFDGTAIIGEDYNGIVTPIALSWPDGNTVTRTVTFPIIADAKNEPNETFTAELTLPPGESGVLGSVTSTEITITDLPTRGVIQFASAAYTVSEADGLITVELTRTGGSTGPIDILITSHDGTAVIGEDYNGILTPLMLSWPDGNTVTRTVSFPILPDVVNETNETFTAVLTLPPGETGVLGSVTSTEITITDDPPGVIQFASATYSVSETGGSITVDLTRTGGSHGVIDVQVSSSDGTAVIGEDYNGIPTILSLSWPDGNTVTRTVTFPILPDVVNEPNETFTAELTLPTGVSGLLGSVTSTEITITDVPAGVIQISTGSHMVVSEDDGFITVELSRTGGSYGAIDVLVSSSDGTAVIGEDYNGIPTLLLLTFPDGNTVPRTVTFPILTDTLNEPNETFTVDLSLPAGFSGLLGSVTSTEIIITDVPPP